MWREFVKCCLYIAIEIGVISYDYFVNWTDEFALGTNGVW